MGKKIAILAITFAILAFTQMATAQQTPKFTRIGTLLSGSPVTHGHYVVSFRQGLREIGYVEGRNYVFVSRWGKGKRKRLPVVAAELVKAKVDVIFVMGGPSLRAAGKATKTIPIVAGLMANIVKHGFVDSLARPGGNITGSTFDRYALTGKLMGLLRETVPGARRMAFLFHPSKTGLRVLKSTEAAAQSLGVKIKPFPVRTPGDIEGAFVTMVNEHADALIIPTSSFTNFHRKRIAALAITKKLPTACDQGSYAQAGCLMAYSADRKHTIRRAAVFVDKILKGANPSELPVELASKYNLVVNLKTAKALGITVPPSILLQATEVIE